MHWYWAGTSKTRLPRRRPTKRSQRYSTLSIRKLTFPTALIRFPSRLRKYSAYSKFVKKLRIHARNWTKRAILRKLWRTRFFWSILTTKTQFSFSSLTASLLSLWPTQTERNRILMSKSTRIVIKIRFWVSISFYRNSSTNWCQFTNPTWIHIISFSWWKTHRWTKEHCSVFRSKWPCLRRTTRLRCRKQPWCGSRPSAWTLKTVTICRSKTKGSPVFSVHSLCLSRSKMASII